MSRSNGKKQAEPPAKPLFVIRGERSLRRVARQVRAEHRRLGLKPSVFERIPLPPKSTK
jgi:hypothetical protein